MSGPLPQSDGHHDRADVRMLARGLVRGWFDTPSEREAAIASLRRVATNDRADPRAQASAAKALLDHEERMAELAQRIGEFDDKTDRLDAEKATEIHGGDFTITIRVVDGPDEGNE